MYSEDDIVNKKIVIIFGVLIFALILVAIIIPQKEANEELLGIDYNIKGNEMVKITEKPKSGNNKKNPNIQVKKKINNCICNIKTNEINKIGFFCIIPFIDSNNLPVLITNHIFFKNAT